ncbi:MAG: T9SS type A sorting domain-containing protein [Chlorobi bacterium]|nr:T9SS type A sorting domain-containing protein [Chlorobiota bacterium]
MWQIKAFLIVVFLFSILSAQDRMILRSNGERIKITNSKDLREAIIETRIISRKGNVASSMFPKLQGIENFIDTISYREQGEFNTNFILFGQDIMMMWFEAPADMTIKAIGFTCSDDAGYVNDGATVGLRLIKLNWTKEDIKKYGDVYQGYYPSADISDFFGENANGNWISKDINNPLPPWTNHENPDSNTFNYDLFSDNGSFFPVIPINSQFGPIYNWLEISSTGLNEPKVKDNEIFAIVAINNGANLDSSRIGFWSSNSIGYSGWKYYKNGRYSADEPGWWFRSYTWDFAVAVDITGDLPPKFVEVTELKTTYSEEPRKVSATIVDSNGEIGGQKGVASAVLVYKIDGNEQTEIQMSNMWNNNYVATIPAQFRGTEVEYFIRAIDINGNESESKLYKYFIFKPTTCQYLVIFNGYETNKGYPQQYYFSIMEGDRFSESYLHADYWMYGPVSEDLINRYSNVFEITTSGPLYDNTRVVRNWLESSPWNDYFLAGDEWLSFRTNWTNTSFQPGSFEYDILGITEVFNNIAEPNTFSLLYPQEGSILADSLYRAMVLNGDEAVHYDPNIEIGLKNYLDGFNVLPDIEVEIKAKGMDGNLYNAALHRTLPGRNNKVVFLSFDPLSLNNTTEYYDPNYFFYGAHSTSLLRQTYFNFWELESDYAVPFPIVSYVTKLSNTSSTSAREVRTKVTTSNPCYSGILDNIKLMYSQNDSDYVSIQMEYVGNDYYSAEIPGFKGGTKVTYYVIATIATGFENDPYHIDRSPKYKYSIDYKTDQKTLIVFNGFEEAEGFPQDYYFLGLEDSLYQSFDKIAAPLSIEIANAYNNIFEICSDEPKYNNRDVIKEWINSNSLRNYFLSGQNYFNKQINSSDSTYKAGDFEYDILSIIKSRANINFSSDENDTITQMIPIQNTILGDALYSNFSNEGYESIEYRYIQNQIDAFLVGGDAEVFMQAIGKDGATYDVGMNRMLPTGNQIVFLSYDPMFIYSKPNSFEYGTSELSPVVQAVYWFERNIVNVKEENIVTNYSISQNYPNPFNPTTIIKYQVPESNFVKIKVYDILGREVRTLVNKGHRAGSYEVEFNAKNLSSGVYFYSIISGDYKEVKKMMLLK